MTDLPDGRPSHVEKSRGTPADPVAAAFAPENRRYTVTIAALLALLAFLAGQMMMAGFTAAAVALGFAVLAVVFGGLDELWCRCKATHRCHECETFREDVVEADLVDDADTDQAAVIERDLELAERVEDEVAS